MTNVKKYLGTVLACFMVLSAILPAQGQESEYALLIVGDSASAEMLREEKVLIDKIAAQIRQSPQQVVKVFSYHFDKANERTYCERRLNVLAEDLLFVGVVRLNEAGSPVKVIYRIDRINNPERAAKDVLARAFELKMENVQTVAVTPPATPPTTPPDNGTTTSVASAGPGFRVQLGVYAQREFADRDVNQASAANLEASILEIAGEDGDTLYKVWSPIMVEEQNAEELAEKFREAGFTEAFVTKVE